MTFRKQLFLILSLATIIPFVILWFSLSEILYKKEVANVKNQHLLIARNLGAALQRYHTDLTASFDIVAGNLVLGNEVAELPKFITKLNFRHFCVTNIQTGKIIAQTAAKTLPCPTTVPDKLFSNFIELAKYDKPVFSPVIAGPNNQPLIFILRKYGDKLVIGAVSTDYFVSIGNMVKFGEKGHAAIVDQVGNVLAHPKPTWIAARKNISKISVVKRMLAGETGVETFYSPALKADMIAGFTSIKGPGWGVMIPQPISELRLAAQAAHGTIFPILAICIFLASLVALLVARMVMKPLDNMRMAAKAVEDGAVNVEVNLDDRWLVPQEFKEMQERFNAMAKSVSHYQSLQEEKRQSAEKNNKRATEYFANLAHELKTPLNSILGFSSILLQAKPNTLKPHEQVEFLGHIEKSAKHLLSFVNDLLELSRLDGGAHKIKEQEFYLRDPIRFCETTLRKQIKDKGIELIVDCDDAETKLFADERAVNQILINLAGNAIRYSFDKGKVKITAGRDRKGDLKIEVYDNGIGIPEGDLEEILQPFKRSNDPNLAEIHGTGLGLSIVSKLANLNGWHFTIESEHGFSTTATLTIPQSCIVDQLESSKVA